MKYFAFFLLISFIGMALFSFILFGYQMDHGKVGCTASAVVGGVVCPANAIDFILHHVFAAKTFSTAFLPLNFDILSVFVLVLCLLIFSFLTRRRSLHLNGDFFFRRLRRFQPDFEINDRKIIRWLSFLEHSPSA